MAAVPALQGHFALPAAPELPAPSRPPRSGDAELEHLRRLAAGITAWRCARLAAHSHDAATAAPPSVPLGAFSRHFAVWLDAHPERANEPLEWLVPEALSAGLG
jgi:hypothetical protein